MKPMPPTSTRVGVQLLPPCRWQDCDDVSAVSLRGTVSDASRTLAPCGHAHRHSLQMSSGWTTPARGGVCSSTSGTSAPMSMGSASGPAYHGPGRGRAEGVGTTGVACSASSTLRKTATMRSKDPLGKLSVNATPLPPALSAWVGSVRLNRNVDTTVFSDTLARRRCLLASAACAAGSVARRWCFMAASARSGSSSGASSGQLAKTAVAHSSNVANLACSSREYIFAVNAPYLPSALLEWSSIWNSSSRSGRWRASDVAMDPGAAPYLGAFFQALESGLAHPVGGRSAVFHGGIFRGSRWLCERVGGGAARQVECLKRLHLGLEAHHLQLLTRALCRARYNPLGRTHSKVLSGYNAAGSEPRLDPLLVLFLESGMARRGRGQ